MTQNADAAGAIPQPKANSLTWPELIGLIGYLGLVAVAAWNARQGAAIHTAYAPDAAFFACLLALAGAALCGWKVLQEFRVGRYRALLIWQAPYAIVCLGLGLLAL
ncbi:MAG TPA: hypothetical protein VMT30_07120 [Candidatus Saccharimonadia bacterium]|nr:hypothetical protein [Candidatus Saccharimonadia bacterium]